MAFTRRYHKQIAGIIYRARTNPNLATVDGHCKEIANRLADLFALDNARFDREKFLSDCGL